MIEWSYILQHPIAWSTHTAQGRLIPVKQDESDHETEQPLSLCKSESNHGVLKQLAYPGDPISLWPELGTALLDGNSLPLS